MDRIADDWRYFHHPDRFLFEQVRAYFPITDQLVVYNLIAKHVERALQVTKTYAARGYKPDGSRLRCRATTRRSTPCMRNIVPGTEYCPSHQHLAEPHFTEQDEVAHGEALSLNCAMPLAKRQGTRRRRLRANSPGAAHRTHVCEFPSSSPATGMAVVGN